MKKLALLPWNVCLLLTTVKTIAQAGIDHFTVQVPPLGPSFSVTGIRAVLLFGLLLCIMALFSWASYKILINRQKNDGNADAVPNFLIFMGTRYFIPVVILEFIASEGNSILRQPVLSNPVFWMSFGYFIMTDTVIFWGRYRLDEKVRIRFLHYKFEMKLYQFFWITVLAQMVLLAAGEINKHKQRGKTDEKKKEEVRNPVNPG